MEGNLKETKNIIFEKDYSKSNEKIFLFEMSEELISRLEAEKSFLIKSWFNIRYFLII